MYRKIIVGYDGSEHGRDALALGKQLAEASNAELVVAGVFGFDPVWGGRDPHFRDAEAEYARVIEKAAESVGAVAEAIPSSSVGRGLHELAEELSADLIVVGSSHHGRAGQVLAGNVGMTLLHASPCSVAVAPRDYSAAEGRRLAEIVVGYDGSTEAQMALEEAIELARAGDALIKLVTVAEPPVVSYGKGGAQGWRALQEGIEELMRERLEEASAGMPDDVRFEPMLVSGEPAAALAEIAKADGALLMLGSRAYGPLRRVLLGTVGGALACTAPCPVIVHPRPPRSRAPKKARMAAGSAL